MTVHTKGPWEVAEPDRNGQAIVRAEEYEVATCWHHCLGSIEKEMEANARLIAAAPELLEALRGIIEIGKRDMSNPKYDGYFESACAAIAKAEGR